MNDIEKVYIVTGYNSLIERRIILKVFTNKLAAEKYIKRVEENDEYLQWRTLENECWTVY